VLGSSAITSFSGILSNSWRALLSSPTAYAPASRRTFHEPAGIPQRQELGQPVLHRQVRGGRARGRSRAGQPGGWRTTQTSVSSRCAAGWATQTEAWELLGCFTVENVKNAQRFLQPEPPSTPMSMLVRWPLVSRACSWCHGGFQNNGRKSSTGGLAGSSDVAVSSRTSSYTRHGELWRKFGMEILLPRNSRWQRGVRIGGRLIAGQTLQPVAGSDTSNCNWQSNATTKREAGRIVNPRQNLRPYKKFNNY
jgi:hypothetical protein